MTKKLTLSLDADLVDFAHELASQTKVRALGGILKDIHAPDKKDIRKMFHEKNCH
jgi:hypothetical protein